MGLDFELREGRRFLKGTQIEVVNENIPRGPKRCALFDFDGTLSLIRSGWQGVMIPMMVELLLQTPKAEPREEVERVVTEFVDRLTGKQTIYQMIRLCEEIKRRGGKPLHPLEYKRMYHQRLWEVIKGRVEALRSWRAKPDDYLLPGARALLENLARRGVKLYLASGTDTEYVLEEARLLRIDQYFEGGIYGAIDEWEKFDKDILIRRILTEHNLRGEELLAFGDGFVEIEETKKVGGVAVGVASEEFKKRGFNEWKRGRLIQAGADLIIPEYMEQEKLVAFLFGEI